MVRHSHHTYNSIISNTVEISGCAFLEFLTVFGYWTFITLFAYLCMNPTFIIKSVITDRVMSNPCLWFYSWLLNPRMFTCKQITEGADVYEFIFPLKTSIKKANKKGRKRESSQDKGFIDYESVYEASQWVSVEWFWHSFSVLLTKFKTY